MVITRLSTPQKYLLAGIFTKCEKAKVQIEQCGSQLVIPVRDGSNNSFIVCACVGDARS